MILDVVHIREVK